MENVICDIIVLTLDQPEVLRLCVESVLKHTKASSRLIIVNNGGGQRIRDYCSSLKPTESVKLKFYDFPENMGFVRGNNIAASEGDSRYVCLLNNDCVVTPAWLERMIDLADKNPKFAAINPQCDTMITHKETSALPYEERSRYFSQFKSQFYVLGVAIGFCMLIPRKVIREIGLFNEEIDTAYFEDADFSYRAKEAGYLCVLAADAYVYHQPFGKASSISMSRRQALMAKNRAWLERKWGKSVRLAIVFDHKRGSDADLQFLLEQAQKLGLSDNHPHLLLGVDKRRYSDFETMLTAFGIKRIESPNLKATLVDSPLFWLYALLRVGFKWRKRYDVIVCDSLKFLGMLRLFKPFLKFWLVYAELSKKAESVWIRNSSTFIDRFYVANGEETNSSIKENSPLSKLIRSREMFFQIRKEMRDAKSK